MSTSGQEEDYKIDVKGKSKTFHVNMVTKYIDRNADPQNVNQDEALVSSAVIDCPEGEDVKKYGLPSVGDKEELSSVDINQELGPEDRQKVTSLLNQFDDVLSDDPGYTHLIEHDIIANSNQTIRNKLHVVSVSLCQIVGKNQLKAQSDKVKTIDEAVVHVSCTKRKLRSVRGHFSFYKKFIPILLSILLLLTCLLKQFILLTDASERGIGAVLMQFDDESGLKLSVENASRKLKVILYWTSNSITLSGTHRYLFIST